MKTPAAEVVKTLVMQDEQARPLIVRHSGYQVGGTSPFGTRKALPVFLERSILELPAIYINDGRRGFLLKVRTEDVVKTLQPRLVEVALDD